MTEIKMWAWVWTDPAMHKQPIISVDETREIVAGEKQKCLQGINPELSRMRRSLYRRTKVIPIKIIY